MRKAVKLWCYIQGKQDVLSVSISPSKNIYELKEQIHQKAPTSLAGCDAMDLQLKKIDVNINDIVSSQSWPSADHPFLQQHLSIRDIWAKQPSEMRVQVFVCLPPGVGGPTADNMGVGGIINSAFLKYEDIFIKVEKWGSYKESDLPANDIRVETLVPDFASNFERELDSRRGLTFDVTNVHPLFDHLSIAQFWDAYFKPHGNTTPEDGERQRRDAKPPEVTHIMNTASSNWEKHWARKPFKEDLAYAMFFSQFLLSVPENGTVIARTGTQPWPFHLVLKCADDSVNKQRKFEPRSDLLIQSSALPRLLVEVNSTAGRPWPPDLVRMLLTGAATVRLANTFLKPFRTKNFTLVTIYIYDDGNATRFTLFQKQNGREVYYKETKFSLGDPLGRVHFVRQFYNLFNMLEGEEEVEDAKRVIQELEGEIERRCLKSLHTKDDANTKGKKRKRSGTGDDASTRGGAAGVGAEDSADLRARGYEVEPEDIVDASGIVYEPLFKMPPHILTVFRPSIPGQKYIAKKVHEESNELEFLKLLSTFQPKSEHLISLLDSFQTQSTSWVILPKMESVADYVAVAPNQLYGKITQVCWGLIQGVAYLHKFRIAHRDIKPSNLVVDQGFCLKIIDFDLAMQVKDEDEEVNDQCGTKHWMAPEVEKKLVYSPIKADRWSSGRVLLYLLDGLKKEDELLRTIGRKLTARSPKQRPSMDEVAAPPSDLPNVACKKALRSRQSKMKIDGDNAKHPKAKKQRLTQNEMVMSAEIHSPQASRPMFVQ